LITELLRDQPPYDVIAAARRERNDQSHRTVWILIGKGVRRERQSEQGGGAQS
jgi:hypothetical protein